MALQKFEKVAFEWLGHSQVSETSKNTYKNLINNKILPFWKDKRLNKLKHVLTQYFEWLYSNTTSKHYVADVIIFFNQICKYAFEQGYINKVYKLKYKSYQSEKIDIFSIDEQNKILDYLIENITFQNIGILLSFKRGLRIGEICALQVKDIDFDNKILHVENTVQRIKNTDKSSTKKTILVVKNPKTNHSIREIPISDEILSILKKLYINSDPQYYLITNNTYFMDTRTYENIYKRLLYNLKIRIVKYHILRHTFATMALQNKVDIEVVSKILGHADASVTYKIYIHITKDYKTKELDKIDNYYNPYK